MGLTPFCQNHMMEQNVYFLESPDAPSSTPESEPSGDHTPSSLHPPPSSLASELHSRLQDHAHNSAGGVGGSRPIFLRQNSLAGEEMVDGPQDGQPTACLGSQTHITPSSLPLVSASRLENPLRYYVSIINFCQ